MNSERARKLLCLLAGLSLAFIWGNSLLSAPESGAVSSRVEGLLLSLFSLDALPFDIRKAAHFFEYALLGALSGGLFALSGQRTLNRALHHASAGLFAAVVDESIQMFTGRGPMVSDILLDFSGYSAGLCALVALTALLRARPKRAQ